MKFKGSMYEDRYNDYWNKNVVFQDQRIRADLGLCTDKGSEKPGFFHDQASALLVLMKEYGQRVSNLLTNLKRQGVAFDDQEYVIDYLRETRDAAINDVKDYLKLAQLMQHHSLKALLEQWLSHFEEIDCALDSSLQCATQ